MRDECHCCDCLWCLTVGQSVKCLTSAAAPTSDADLVVNWNAYHTIATYICRPGWYFPEGGTRRTLECTNGTWPRHAPMCTGNVQQEAQLRQR